MALELTTYAGYTYAKGGVMLDDSFVKPVTVAAAGEVAGEVASSVADTALPLGGLTTLGHGFFRNVGPTGNIKLKSAISGTVLALLAPGGPPAFIPFDTTITAPSFQASAGTPILRYALFPP